MEQGRNKVFINPNFNKMSNNSGPIKQMPVMHVNPNFCHNPQSAGTGSKIFINPNFVRPNVIRNQTPYLNAHFHPSPLKDSNKLLTAHVPTVKQHEGDGYTRVVLANPATTHPFQANSRYSLVRQKASEPLQPKMTNTQKNTVKISKYKSIKITDMKKNLESVKLPGKSIDIVTDSHKSIKHTKTSGKNINPHSLITHGNKYTLISPSTTVNKPQIKRRTSINSKKIIYNRNRTKSDGVYKKNNIPCPQFRKYGKCLRNIQGRCIFLHDKKHVSICRKFLTGACHDIKCLLSHELSHKKMPTCYFYLNGMCTKDGCPYLHVKLNEKAKICPDFVRGYCDKGEKCLNKHISKSLAIDAKLRLSLRKQSPQKSVKYKLDKSKVKTNVKNTQKKKSKVQIPQHPHLEKNNESGERYYKGSIQENDCMEHNEVIKPSRCKLGALPSFIQL